MANDSIDIWMPLFIGDFYRDMASLNDAEFTCYMRMLVHCWYRGSMPNNIEALFSIVGSNLRDVAPVLGQCRKHCNIQASPTRLQSMAEYSREITVRQVLQQFFVLGEDGLWRNEKLDAEKAKWAAKQQRATEHGKRAVEAREAKRNSSRDHLGIIAIPSPSPSPLPIPINTDSSQSADSLPFLLKDGTAYEVSGEQIAVWQKEYQTINVRHALLKMQASHRANPRCDRDGIETAILRWLGAEKPPAAAQESEPQRAKPLPSQPVAVAATDEHEHYLTWQSMSENYKRENPWGGPIPAGLI